ncbi:hypothetical protein D3C77_427120 [compost metagenome]
MYNPLRHLFAVKMGNLLDKMVILKHGWTAVTNRADILVIFYRMALACCQRLTLHIVLVRYLRVIILSQMKPSFK